jgi:hypothetical protein
MQYVGVKVSPVRPRKGSRLWIHADSLEQTLISGYLFESWPPQKGSQVHLALCPIRETERHNSFSDYLNVCDIDHNYPRGWMLPGSSCLSARSQHTSSSCDRR